MVYSFVVPADAERDLDQIFDFLFESHIGFGESSKASFGRAIRRIRAIRRDAASIARTPNRGTLEDALLPGLRHVTINRAIFYFDVDEGRQQASILAVFFGGQDHRRRILARLQ